MRDGLAWLGRLFDFVTRLVFVAVLIAACAGAEVRLVPMACWTEGPGAGVFVIVVLTLAAVGSVLLCCPRRLP